jgi:hypothetical protein
MQDQKTQADNKQRNAASTLSEAKAVLPHRNITPLAKKERHSKTAIAPRTIVNYINNKNRH